MSAAWYWKKRGLNELADDARYKGVSLRVNKTLDSFPKREIYRKHALDALCRGILVDLTMSLSAARLGGWF